MFLLTTIGKWLERVKQIRSTYPIGCFGIATGCGINNGEDSSDSGSHAELPESARPIFTACKLVGFSS